MTNVSKGGYIPLGFENVDSSILGVPWEAQGVATYANLTASLCITYLEDMRKIKKSGRVSSF